MPDSFAAVMEDMIEIMSLRVPPGVFISITIAAAF
jgi:hypothetical protein